MEIEVLKAHIMHIQQQVDMLNTVKENFGDEVVEAVKEAYCANSLKPYFSVFEKFEDRSIDAMCEVLWLPLKQKGFEFTLRKIPNGIQVICTTCPWAKLYNACNGNEWGYRLVCDVDSRFVERFNPDMKFERTKTLMMGDDCCNHTYTCD